MNARPGKKDKVNGKLHLRFYWSNISETRPPKPSPFQVRNRERERKRKKEPKKQRNKERKIKFIICYFISFHFIFVNIGLL